MAEIKVRKRDIQQTKRPDAVLQSASSTFDWLFEHRMVVGGLIAVVLVAVGGFTAAQAMKQSRFASVGGELSDAIAVDVRPVATKDDDEDDKKDAKKDAKKKEDDDSFATQADKDKATEAALLKVTTDHPGTASAASASLMLAGKHFEAGKYDETITLAQSYIADPQGGSLKAFALETLGDAYAAKKDIAKAEDAYKQLGEAGNPALALFLQGTLKESAGKPDEARKLYEQVISDYDKDEPGKAAGKEARTRLDVLQLPPPGVGNLEAPPMTPEEIDAMAKKAAAPSKAPVQLKTGKSGGK